MFPSPEDQQRTDDIGLEGAGGVAGDARNEPDDAPTEGSDADEISFDSATPAGIAETLAGDASHEDG